MTASTDLFLTMPSGDGRTVRIRASEIVAVVSYTKSLSDTRSELRTQKWSTIYLSGSGVPVFDVPVLAADILETRLEHDDTIVGKLLAASPVDVEKLYPDDEASA